MNANLQDYQDHMRRDELSVYVRDLIARAYGKGLREAAEDKALALRKAYHAGEDL